MDFDINTDKVYNIVADALHGSDGGELFLEEKKTEIFSYENGVLNHSDFTHDCGFGLRSFVGDKVAFAHSNCVDESSLRNAANIVNGIRSNKASSHVALDENSGKVYKPLNPVNEMDFTIKVNLLKEIDEYIRAKGSYIKQVRVILMGNWQEVEIINANGSVKDIRPLVRLSIMINVEKNSRIEQGISGFGGRYSYENIFSRWKYFADDAIRQAMINVESIPIKAGGMVVVLGNGWPGIILHEAIGHGLEGDFNRRKTSAFSDLLSNDVASSQVTIVDDGTLSDRRGSLNIDDEGHKSQYNTLIEKGRLVGYMQDGLNGKIMGVGSSGNGRRESYADVVMPRMTNTYMLPGECDPQEIIAGVKYGLYAVSFSGGQVDITSGKFVFSSSEAYLIENGKITAPVQKATLIGDGPSALKEISMVGNDLKLDDGIGMCGKDGQSVPVGVGQPTIKVDNITVGGTQ